MSAQIRSVRAKDSKPPLVVLTVACEDIIIKYTVTEGTYRNIGCPLSGEEIDEDALEIIASEDEYRRALAKALSLISYSDKTERVLYSRLIASGFCKNAASAAVKECVMLGYVNEERQIEHLIYKYYRALEGPSKILMRLASRGYSGKDARAVLTRMRDAGELDFKASKKMLLDKKYPDGATPEEIKKLLYKYGYGHG